MSSLCDKLMCLGKRQELESLKTKLMGRLTDVAMVDFENVSMFQNNEDEDQVKYFLDWVDRNKKYSGADEVVANIDANKQRLNVANVKLNELKDMYMKIRELAVLAADDAHTGAQRTEFESEANSIRSHAWDMYNNLTFNGQKVFNHADTAPATFSAIIDLDQPAITYSSVATSKPEQTDFTWGAAADANSALSTIDGKIANFESQISSFENVYKKISRARENVLRQKAQGYKNLESQRAQAKRRVEKKICNIMNQVAYLNVCISHNGH